MGQSGDKTGTAAVPTQVTQSGTAADNADAVTPVATGLGRNVAETFAYNGTNWDRQRSMGAAGDGLGVMLASQPSSTYGSASNTGGAANVTFAAVAGQFNRLTMAQVAYSNTIGTAASGAVADPSGTGIFSWLATNQPTGPALPSGGIKQAAVNNTVVVSIQGGGVTTTGWVLAAKITA